MMRKIGMHILIVDHFSGHGYIGHLIHIHEMPVILVGFEKEQVSPFEIETRIPIKLHLRSNLNDEMIILRKGSKSLFSDSANYRPDKRQYKTQSGYKRKFKQLKAPRERRF